MKKYLFLIFAFASYILPAQNSEWMCFYETNISTCLGEDNDYIWAGSLSGISRINKTTGDVTWFNEQNTPIPERWMPIPFFQGAYNIETDVAGNLYTKRDKVYKYNGTDTVSIPGCPYINMDPYYEAAPLMIVTDEGEIWMDYTDTTFIQGDDPYTYNGIAHYDLNLWTKYNINNSPLPSPHFVDIEMAPDGSIWISTYEGLAHLSNGIWSIYNSANSTLPYTFINQIAIDQSGDVWFSDLHYGLYRFTGTEIEQFIHPTMGQDVGYGPLTIDIDGSIWQCCYNSLVRFDGTDFTHYFTEDTCPMGSGQLMAFSIDQYGNKWIGTSEGFVVYREGGVITGLEPELINSNQSVHTFPNPFTDQITFSFDQEHSLIKITIFDALGKLVYNNLFRNTNELFVKTNIRKGLYFYRIETNNGIVFSGKISGGSK